MRARFLPLLTTALLALAFAPGASSQSFLTSSKPSSPALPGSFPPFSRVGFSLNAGFGGVGLDIATPLSRTLNLRVGANYFSYSTTFQDQGANISAQLRLQSEHASIDYFPFHNQVRVSPMVVLNNDNRAQATALVPSGSTITLNGQNYISSPTDPLHGAGSVDFRKVSPGLTFGWGNIVPRTSSRFSFPFEAGFYHVGQPGLKVAFSGSACDPTEPLAIGCQSVDEDAGFQQSLSQFVLRNDHNLSYASFFPVFSVGLGYSFPPSRSR